MSFNHFKDYKQKKDNENEVGFNIFEKCNLIKYPNISEYRQNAYFIIYKH